MLRKQPSRELNYSGWNQYNIYRLAVTELVRYHSLPHTASTADAVDERTIFIHHRDGSTVYITTT